MPLTPEEKKQVQETHQRAVAVLECLKDSQMPEARRRRKPVERIEKVCGAFLMAVDKAARHRQLIEETQAAFYEKAEEVNRLIAKRQEVEERLQAAMAAKDAEAVALCRMTIQAFAPMIEEARGERDGVNRKSALLLSTAGLDFANSWRTAYRNLDLSALEKAEALTGQAPPVCASA